MNLGRPHCNHYTSTIFLTRKQLHAEYKQPVDGVAEPHPVVEPYIRSHAGIHISLNPEWRVSRKLKMLVTVQITSQVVKTDELNNLLDPRVSRWCLRHSPWVISLVMLALLHLCSRYSVLYTLYNSVPKT
jgi:hypothetical protein